jgi:hypothetical protein
VESVTDLFSYHVTLVFTYVYVLNGIVVLVVDVAGQAYIHPEHYPSTQYYLVLAGSSQCDCLRLLHILFTLFFTPISRLLVE